jgi:MFS family permease
MAGCSKRQVLNGVGAAVNKSVMVQVIADIFFLHERGQWMGVYFTFYFLGTFFGPSPIVVGNMAHYVGWRNFLSVFNIISILVALPKTKLHRTSVSTQSSPYPSSTSGAGAKAPERRAGRGGHPRGAMEQAWACTRPRGNQKNTNGNSHRGHILEL